MEAMDDTQQFEKTTVDVLNRHTNALNQIERAITAAAQKKTPVRGLKEIYKEIADSAHACETTVDYYEDEEAMSEPVRTALGRLLQDIKTCAMALVLHANIA